jgi:hypothetical protein
MIHIQNWFNKDMREKYGGHTGVAAHASLKVIFEKLREPSVQMI